MYFGATNNCYNSVDGVSMANSIFKKGYKYSANFKFDISPSQLCFQDIKHAELYI